MNTSRSAWSSIFDNYLHHCSVAQLWACGYMYFIFYLRQVITYILIIQKLKRFEQKILDLTTEITTSHYQNIKNLIQHKLGIFYPSISVKKLQKNLTVQNKRVEVTSMDQDNSTLYQTLTLLTARSLWISSRNHKFFQPGTKDEEKTKKTHIEKSLEDGQHTERKNCTKVSLLILSMTTNDLRLRLAVQNN